MSNLEQQSEEIEALSSIFPDEFHQIELNSEEAQGYMQKYPHWKQEKFTNLISVELAPQLMDNQEVHGNYYLPSP
jgi:hypothetical protein